MSVHLSTVKRQSNVSGKILFDHSIRIDNMVADVLKLSEMFPNEDDLSGAAFSLAQLQGAYRLNVSQLASGSVPISNGISYRSVKRLDGISNRSTEKSMAASYIISFFLHYSSGLPFYR